MLHSRVLFTRISGTNISVPSNASTSLTKPGSCTGTLTQHAENWPECVTECVEEPDAQILEESIFKDKSEDLDIDGGNV